MRISDWSSGVCSSDLERARPVQHAAVVPDAEIALAPFVGVDEFGPRDVVHQVEQHHAALGHRHADALAGMRGDEIGRASGRERVCQYVWYWVFAVSLKTKYIRNITQ